MPSLSKKLLTSAIMAATLLLGGSASCELDYSDLVPLLNEITAIKNNAHSFHVQWETDFFNPEIITEWSTDLHNTVAYLDDIMDLLGTRSSHSTQYSLIWYLQQLKDKPFPTQDLSRIESFLSYSESGETHGIVEPVLDIRNSLVSEKSGIKETVADLNHDIRSLLQTNNFYLSQLLQNTNVVAGSSFNFTNLLAILSGQSIENVEDWLYYIGDDSWSYTALAKYGVSLLGNYLFGKFIIPDSYNWSFLLDLIYEDPALQHLYETVALDLEGEYVGTALDRVQYSTEFWYKFYNTYELSEKVSYITNYLATRDNILQDLYDKIEPSFVNDGQGSFDYIGAASIDAGLAANGLTSDFRFYDMNTNIVSIGTNSVYETPDSGYQGQVDGITTETEDTLNMAYATFFGKLNSNISDFGSQFDQGSPIIDTHITAFGVDRTITLDYTMKTKARQKVEKFWQWIFSIVRWTLYVWGTLSLARSAYAIDYAESAEQHAVDVLEGLG